MVVSTCALDIGSGMVPPNVAWLLVVGTVSTSAMDLGGGVVSHSPLDLGGGGGVY